MSSGIQPTAPAADGGLFGMGGMGGGGIDLFLPGQKSTSFYSAPKEVSCVVVSCDDADAVPLVHLGLAGSHAREGTRGVRLLD